MTTYHTDFDAAFGRGAGMQRLINLSGALVSAALIGGAAYWGYELMMRDVAGVPVVQAMDGAFRVAPDDPGGMSTPHQGLAVNEIPAVGTAGGPAAEVTLAPPPEALAEDDKPQKTLAEEADAAAIVAAAPEEDPDLAALTDPTAGAEAVVPDAAPEGALATDLAVMEALMGVGAPDGADVVQVRAAGETDATRSPRPEPRPEDDTQMAALDTAVDGGSPAGGGAGPVTEIEADSLPAGTKMAQLGAFASPEIAREHWARIADRFGDSFAGKRRVIQEAEAGGSTFWRLRAEGFADLSDARRFCSTLLSDRTDCIPVELR